MEENGFNLTIVLDEREMMILRKIMSDLGRLSLWLLLVFVSNGKLYYGGAKHNVSSS